MIASNALIPSRPCAATIPSSAICARNALITWVRWRSSRSRVSMLHQLTLLLGRLDAYEAHGWASDRLADRLGISGIILVTLDISLHILRRHQTHLMAELRQFACPVVRRSTGFHADQARRQSLEEPHHLTAAELLPDDDLLQIGRASCR